MTTFANRIKKPPQTPRSLNEAVGLLGKLEGHLGQVGGSRPLAEGLWPGSERLADIEIAYAFTTETWGMKFYCAYCAPKICG